MGFSRQEYWSRLPFLSPGDLPNPGIESGSTALQADSLFSDQQGIIQTLNSTHFNPFNNPMKLVLSCSFYNGGYCSKDIK